MSATRDGEYKPAGGNSGFGKKVHNGKEAGLFDFAAEVGMANHIGGVEAAEELAGLCCIG
jgi:hypothetical protein